MDYRTLILPLLAFTVAPTLPAQESDRRILIDVITTVDGNTRHERIELDGGDEHTIAEALRELGLDGNAGIPSDSARVQVNIERLIEGAKAPSGEPHRHLAATAGRPYLGVSTSDLAPEDRIRLKVPVKEGAFIVSVAKGSPAAAIGLLEEDVIVQVAERKIGGPGDLLAAVRDHEAGDAVKLTWFRGARKMSAMVTLAEREGNDRWPGDGPGEMPAEFRSLMEELEQRSRPGIVRPFLGVSPPEQDTVVMGAPVGRVEAGSTAADMGVLPGDVIRSINDEQVDSFEGLRQRVLAMRPGDPVRLTVLRNGKELDLSGTLGSAPQDGGIYLLPPADGAPRMWRFGPEDMPPGDAFDLRQQMDQLRREMDELRRDLGHDPLLRDGASGDGPAIDDATRALLRGKGVKGLDQHLELTNLRLFPDPGSAFFRLEFGAPERGDLQVMVYDGKGERVYHETITGFKGRYERTLDLGDLPAGTYALVIAQGQRTATRELVKR